MCPQIEYYVGMDLLTILHGRETTAVDCHMCGTGAPNSCCPQCGLPVCRAHLNGSEHNCRVR